MDPYEEVSQQGQVPPLSLAYVPDPMELGEHVPVYVPELEHPEYHAPLDDDIQVEDQPHADDASPTAESLGYIADSDLMGEDNDKDPEEDPSKEHEPEDDDEDPEEDPSKEHEPEDDDEDPEEDPNEEHKPEDKDTKEEEPSEGSDETESFEEDETSVTPPQPRHRGARISVIPHTPMAASTQALIDAFATGSTLFLLPPTSPAYDQAPVVHRTATICRRDDIPEEDMPHQRRFVFTAPPPGCDAAESSTAAARAPRGQYDFIDTVEAGKGLIRSPGSQLEDQLPSPSSQIDVMRGQMTAYETELQEVRQAYLSFEAQNRTQLARLKTLETHMSHMKWKRQSAEDLAVTQMMHIHALEARA
nr:hypothetical protein [Tanacetum cinerariifolium]